MTTPIFAWHIHHDTLFEMLTEPIETRIAYIREEKREDEVELRLRLLKPVAGKLPEAIYQAREKYSQAREKYIQAEVEYGQAEVEYGQARKKYRSEIEALHAIECPDCPWDGTTIFPGED